MSVHCSRFLSSPYPSLSTFLLGSHLIPRFTSIRYPFNQPLACFFSTHVSPILSTISSLLLVSTRPRTITIYSLSIFPAMSVTLKPFVIHSQLIRPPERPRFCVCFILFFNAQRINQCY